MSQTQINNNKKIAKVKKPKPKGNLACILTLVLSIVCSISLFTIALAPFLYGLFGVTMFLICSVGLVIVTILSAGLIWTSETVRTNTGNLYIWIAKIFDGPDQIVKTLQPTIILTSIMILLGSVAGFVVNLIFFIKHKQNKVKFILSCIFLFLAILNCILAISIYWNWK